MLFSIRDQLGREFRQIWNQLQTYHSLCARLGFTRGLPASREWAASPDLLLEIADQALRNKPRSIVECSCGVSTLVLARCAQINGVGHVYSLEHNAHFAGVTRTRLAEYGLAEWATVLDAPLREHRLRNEVWPWYTIEMLPSRQIDMLVVDGPPMPIRRYARYPAGPLLFPNLAPGAMVVLDDASRSDERQIAAWWGEEFPRFRAQFHEFEKGCLCLFAPAEERD